MAKKQAKSKVRRCVKCLEIKHCQEVVDKSPNVGLGVRVDMCAACRCGFTPAEATKILSAVQAAWNYVAYDYVQMGGGSISRAEAIEGAVDASRPVDIGKLDKALYQRLIRLTDEDLTEMLSSVFPHARYGL
jgi:hypothetical protein